MRSPKGPKLSRFFIVSPSFHVSNGGVKPGVGRPLCRQQGARVPDLFVLSALLAACAQALQRGSNEERRVVGTVPTTGRRACRPPPRWDHLELSPATSMGPPSRQQWDHPW